MEIMHFVMLAMFAGCICGMFVAIRNKEMSMLRRALMLIFCTIGIIISSMVVYITPSDEPRYQIVKGDECAIVQVEDDFVVVQLGDGRLDTIPRTLRPITNWEPVERDLSQEIDFKEGASSENEYNLTIHYKDGSEKHCTMIFANTLKPNSNWKPVR